MDITIGEEKIIELVAPLTESEIRERAMAKRVDAFGQVAKLFQRPKPEEIELLQVQKRFEPFWYGAARALYKYDRRHHYQVPTTPEVQSVTFYEQEHAVEKNVFQLDALEHCQEELTKELLLEPLHGNERDYTKYLLFPRREPENLDALPRGRYACGPARNSQFVPRRQIDAGVDENHSSGQNLRTAH